jgi:hypothetical protein
MKFGGMIEDDQQAGITQREVKCEKIHCIDLIKKHKSIFPKAPSFKVASRFASAQHVALGIKLLGNVIRTFTFPPHLPKLLLPRPGRTSAWK